MSQKPETESKSAFARRIGVSKARVSQLIKAGLPVKPDGSIDIAEGLAWIAAHLDHSRRTGAKAAKRNGSAEPAGEEIGSLYEAKLAHMRVQVQRAQLAYEKERGQLIDRDRAAALVFALARQERDAWVNWPARVAAIMATELGADPAAMQVALERHVRAHLEELAEPRFLQ